MTFLDHYKLARTLEKDHAPDGYPAVQMQTISVLCNRIDDMENTIHRLNSRIIELEKIIKESKVIIHQES